MTGWNPCSVPVCAPIKWRPLGILGWSLVTVGMEPKQQSRLCLNLARLAASSSPRYSAGVSPLLKQKALLHKTLG